MQDFFKKGFSIAFISIMLNILLFVIKYIAGTQINSIALMADAWHSLSDSVTSVVVIFGFWYAAKPPDYKHPYGHGRSEAIASIIVGTLLGMVGVEIFIDSISRFSDHSIVEYDSWAIWALVISILSKEIIAQVSIRYGKKIDSKTLIADGWHHRTDSISSVIILIGAIFNYFWWFDAVMGISVAVLILYITYEIMLSSSHNLLGEKPDEACIKEVIDIAHEVDPRIEDVHNFRLHSYGSHKELDLDFRLPSKMTVQESHEIATRVSKTIMEKMKIRTTIHLEPIDEHQHFDSDLFLSTQNNERKNTQE